jgi:hypothetical protein
MQIRANQIEEMSQAKREESFRRLLVDLRQSAPSATSQFDDESLLSIIRQACDKAANYGVKSSDATTAFVKMAVFAGINFDDDPTIRQYLRTPDLDPDYKVSLLAELVTQKINEGT